MMTDEEHRTWKKARILELQRQRRQASCRIDLYLDSRAWDIVQDECAARPMESYQSVINRIIEEWYELR